MASHTYSLLRHAVSKSHIRPGIFYDLKQRVPSATASDYTFSVPRLITGIFKRCVIPSLGAMAVILTANPALALPKNSITTNGNYIVFNFDKSLGQYDHMGQVQLYQTKTELMVKFTNTRSYAEKIEHTLKYKLVHGALAESDKLMIDHCIESFTKAAQGGTIFYLMVDKNGATSCAVDLT